MIYESGCGIKITNASEILSHILRPRYLVSTYRNLCTVSHVTVKNNQITYAEPLYIENATSTI